MNPAEYAIKHKTISWMVIVIFLVGGTLAYQSLGRLEDPAFTIKDAMIITQYPGASPEQVEEEVTYPIENAIQQLSYVDQVKSTSSSGLSQINVTIKNTYAGDELKQVWDELRRKVTDMQDSLPPGVEKPIVNDDFGDVFGIMLVITGIEQGYQYEELSDYVDLLKRELVLVDGVAKVSVAGALQKQVFIEISRSKLASLGISLQRIYEILETQNIVSHSGQVKVGSELLRIHPTGEFKDIKELETLIISEPGATELVYLGSVAKILSGYEEVPRNIIHFAGERALNVGVSFSTGVNVVEIGEAINKRLEELEFRRPLGMQIHTVYNQPNEVSKSVNAFVMNLAQAVAIVIVVLLLFMGLRSGVLIGLILLLTVLGSFIFMKLYAIDLQRISLGALIIALGMLVDNAIVVTEGILIGLQRGMTKLAASKAIVKQTMWPLLGATVIAVLAFAPIGLSDDATGEFAGSLFYVLLISLLMSWFTAITLTPFLCDLLLKQPKIGDLNKVQDPYNGFIFVAYKKLLTVCMRFRGLTILSLIGLLFAAVYGFSFVKQSFFPPSITPIFLVDYWRSEGTDIRETEQDIAAIEKYLLNDKRVVAVTSTTGRGAQRFMLTYASENSYSSYGQLIIRVNTFEEVISLMNDVTHHLSKEFPNSQFKIKRLEIGPSSGAKIEARFSGADPQVLRSLSLQTKNIFLADKGITNIRDDWREKVKVIRPQFSEAQARRVGISKKDLDDALLMSFTGKQVGLYRDGTAMLPIVARLPEEQRLNIDDMSDVQIWSPTLKDYIAIDQVVSAFDTEWENALIMRRDRKRTITVMADPDPFSGEMANTVFQRIRADVEAINLPTGYEFEWGGEFENSSDAQASLFGSLPMGFLAMFIITVFLFNAIRTPIIIWMTVPLAIIGVTVGLLILDKPFGFMALLGFLSLSGMLIKNGIVLVDQINIELAQGTEPYKAVVLSAVSRVRPVAMAAITTILGMMPLLLDAFFESMAVVIMFGLGFATFLTLIVVPVMYSVFYKIKPVNY